jgi:hypothetical protein
LIVCYETANTLFTVIRLGPTFMITGCFIQRLLLNFDNNQGNNADRSALQQKIKSLWASNLPFVFTYLLNGKYSEELLSKVDNMKLLHFLFAGPSIFIPFPFRPKALQLSLKHDPQQSVTEEYPFKNGDKNLAKPFDFSGQVR